MKEGLSGWHFASQPEKLDYNNFFKDLMSSVYSEKYLVEALCKGVLSSLRETNL
jgi:hypothetical protein